MHSVNDLSDAAKIAYQAFLDMSESKAAYFSCLETIDAKYESGGAPSVAENLELEGLLATHDKNVLAFTTAMTAVAEDEKQSLVRLMS